MQFLEQIQYAEPWVKAAVAELAPEAKVMGCIQIYGPCSPTQFDALRDRTDELTGAAQSISRGKHLKEVTMKGTDLRNYGFTPTFAQEEQTFKLIFAW